jgi:hypothetical protein
LNAPLSGSRGSCQIHGREGKNNQEPFILVVFRFAVQEEDYQNRAFLCGVLLGKFCGAVLKRRCLLCSVRLFVTKGSHIVVPELCFLLIREILLFVGVKVPFHLPDDMLGLVMVFNFEICRCLGYFVGMSAERAEFPLLEPVYVREGFASPRAPDNEVHT